jgi:hypothetical protein
MLEIIFLFLLCRDIGRVARKHDRKPIAFQILLVVLWFGGELLGGFLAALGMAMITGRYEGVGLLDYVIALACGGLGAYVAFRLAKSTASPPMPSGFPVVMAEPLPPAADQISDS